jgi:hypothetical protein
MVINEKVFGKLKKEDLPALLGQYRSREAGQAEGNERKKEKDAGADSGRP